MQIDQKLRTAMDAQETGRVQEAEKLYWDILRERPNDGVALFNVGAIQFNYGNHKAAVELIQRSLKSFDANPAAHNALGLAFTALGKKQEAVVSYRKSIGLHPQYHDAYINLGILLLDIGNIDEAVQTNRQALLYQPNSFLIYYNLGVALQRQGKASEAADAFKKAVALQPAFPEAYCNLGLALMGMGKREEAIQAYQQAIALRPNFPEALNNLGQPLSESGRVEEAADVYTMAAALRPADINVQTNLVHTLRKLGKMGQAIDVCRKALTVTPDSVKMQLELANLRKLTCDWQDFKGDTRHLLSALTEIEPFLVLGAPSNLKEQAACAKSWASKIRRGAPFKHDRFQRAPGGRIRIGYLSSDFHMHATAFLMAELFERHDRSKFEIFGYSYDRGDESEIRKRVIKGFDHFVDLYAVSDTDAAQRIYNDKIDILVDLKGYTQDTRTGILVDRPAPLQINYVGYPGTMGADFIDYIIGDPVVTPMEHQPFYSEKIVQMPHCYQPNDSKKPIDPRPLNRSECGLPEKGFVFCCFNASTKLIPDFFGIWMRLLKAVPDSVLWLISMNNAEAEVNLRREAMTHGVKPERIVFAKAVHLPVHLARHRLADLFLDTLPYGAHTTASDALWAGLPLLTCIGPAFPGRVAASALQAVGLPELIVSSLAAYEAKALDLAIHPEKLKQLKAKLAQNLPTAPLFDTTRYTKDLEAAYKHMWENWRNDKPPEAFAVKA